MQALKTLHPELYAHVIQIQNKMQRQIDVY